MQFMGGAVQNETVYINVLTYTAKIVYNLCLAKINYLYKYLMHAIASNAPAFPCLGRVAINMSNVYHFNN